jgi:hypothetical protein
VFPFPGGTAGAIAPNPEAGRPGHFAWSNWIRQFVLNLDNESVKRSGDSMAGPLSVQAPTAAAHAATKAYVDSMADGMPVGAIIQFASTTVPSAKWHLCDGSPHNSPALAAVLAGSPDPQRTPDLRGAFIVAANAAGAGAPAISRTSYALRATGGADLVLLTAAQSGLRNHSHSTPAHSHVISHGHGTATASWVGGHHHGGYGNNWLGSSMEQNPPGTDYSPIGQGPGRPDPPLQPGSAGDHNHSVAIPSHTGSSTTAAPTTDGSGDLNASTAHENRPPFFALVYLIKKA